MACTGIEFCKLAIVETKERATRLIDELEQRLADVRPVDEPITINVNGCPNSCARIQVADIGLKGSSSPTTTATRSRASRSTSAAASGLDAGFGRKLRGLKVTAAELPDYVERSCAASTTSASRRALRPVGRSGPTRRAATADEPRQRSDGEC